MNPRQTNNSYRNINSATAFATASSRNATGFINDVKNPSTLTNGTPLSPAPSPAAPPDKSQEPRFRFNHNWRSAISTLLLLAIAPLIAFAITAYAVQSYQVDGESMEPTLQNNDRLIVDKIPRTMARLTGHTYIPHRGDIIIFNQSNLPDSSFGQPKQLIKRVIGLPGDHVVVSNGTITIFNKTHPNGFNPDKTMNYHPNEPTTGNINLVLGKSQLYVCGDNRPNSEDSRFFGPIQAHNIVGKLVLRLLPINKTKTF